MQIRNAIWVPQGGNCLRKQLPRLVLEMQEVIGPYVVENPLQGRSVGAEEKELLPETLGDVCLVRIVLAQRCPLAVVRPAGLEVRACAVLAGGRSKNGAQTCLQSATCQRLCPQPQTRSRAMPQAVLELPSSRADESKGGSQTLNSASYRRTILGWNTSGRGWCVRGEGSMG